MTPQCLLVIVIAGVAGLILGVMITLVAMADANADATNDIDVKLEDFRRTRGI